MRRPPWPDAPPARAALFTPTRARPVGRDLVRSRHRRDPCARDRSPPGFAPPSPPPFAWAPIASAPCAGVAAGRRERQSRAVAHGAVPRGGVRDGVRHLWVLLPGAGLLWGGLPRARATGRWCADSARWASSGRHVDHRDRRRVMISM